MRSRGFRARYSSRTCAAARDGTYRRMSWSDDHGKRRGEHRRGGEHYKGLEDGADTDDSKTVRKLSQKLSNKSLDALWHNVLIWFQRVRNQRRFLLVAVFMLVTVGMLVYIFENDHAPHGSSSQRHGPGSDDVEDDEEAALVQVVAPTKPSVKFVKPSAIAYETYEFSSVVPLSNSTLGFSAIFALYDPRRPDRLDQMVLAASAAGLNLTTVPAVTPAELDVNALPDAFDTADVGLHASDFSQFMSHAKIWRKMVELNLPNALILDDEQDFDLNIRRIVTQVRPVLRRVSGDEEGSYEYPLWDMLSLGACYEQPYEAYEIAKKAMPMSQVYQEVSSDRENVRATTVPWISEIMEKYFHDRTPRRVVVRAKNPLCLNAYVFTQSAARSMLIELNDWMPFALDVSILQHVSSGRLTSFTVIPPLVRCLFVAVVVRSANVVSSLPSGMVCRATGLSSGVHTNSSRTGSTLPGPLSPTGGGM